MGKRKYLNQKQLAVLEDLFNSELDEQGVLDKHKVRRSTYDRWLADKLFSEYFRQHVNGLKRRSELLMAKYGCLAASKLVELTESEKPETARKACLDIIGTLRANSTASPEVSETSKEQVERFDGGGAERLSPDKASRLLAALAEEKG